MVRWQSWHWPYPLPEWQDQSDEPFEHDRRVPGRDDSPEVGIIARSQRGDTSDIEGAIERLRRQSKRGTPPRKPPDEPPPPPWSPDRGSDVCAWYYSFRYGDIFGIYICEECVDRIANELWLRGIPDYTALEIAFAFLYGHEIFHYRVDRAVEWLELSVGRANGRPSAMWLNRWKASTHHKPGAGLDLLEEACANRHGLSEAVTRAGNTVAAGSTSSYAKISKSVLGAMMDRSGPGYRDYARVGRPNTHRSQDELLSWYLLLSGSAAKVHSAPIKEIRRTMPDSVRKGGLGIDPSVPLYWVSCASITD